MKKRILCYGDSNTWGYIPGTAFRYEDDVRWTGVLKKRLGDGFTVLEDGISGRTTVFDQEWARGRNGLKGLDYSLQSQMPLDLVTVMLGTNDVSDLGMWRVELGIDEIVRTLMCADSIVRTNSPIFPNGPKVLLIAPPPFHPHCLSDPDSTVTEAMYLGSLKFPEICSRVAKNRGAFFLDGSNAAEVSELDNTHMTEIGHRNLGNLVADKILEIFSE